RSLNRCHVWTATLRRSVPCHSLSSSQGGHTVPDTIEIQLKKGVLGLCVLALLDRGDSYAYEIASRLSDAIDMGEGTIYPLMRRMQSDGLVETYLVESSSGPSRKYYRLSSAGRRALDGQTGEWRAFARAVEALIAGDDDESVIV